MSTLKLGRRRFLEAAGLTGLAMTVAANAQAVKRKPAPTPGRKPNIIFILADDMGYADLSCYGAQGYKTPVLDRLAEEGVKLDNAYANAAICSPTRTALVTGRYQGRFKAGINEPNADFRPGDELPAGTPTVASLLKQQGYRTALVGKWHVCKIPEFGPQKYGYDSFFGIVGGGADYFTHGIPGYLPGKLGMYEGEQLTQRDGYLTDIIADEAIKQIKAGGDKPLFLSLHFNAPHWPWEGPEDRAHAEKLTDFMDMAGGSLEVYAEMMKSMDANIGRVLEALDEMGMTDDTLIVFTSDNGGERYSNTWPLTGYKGELLEGGIRVPLIARWPGRIPAGSKSSQVLISMDTVPTFLAAAGGATKAKLDGVNLLPQLTGQAAPVERTLFWRYKAHDQAAVRHGNWKYLRIGGKELLFDVARDPRERAQLQDVHPEILADLKARWQAWNAEMLPYPPRGYSENVDWSYPDRYPMSLPNPWHERP
ncbi:MAG: sulfatase-like hydrolase/transferase [Pseudoxanthomonas sp.]